MSKIGRNDPCPCGSGKKYKKCCESKVPVSWVPVQLDVDRLSNSVLPLIKEKRFDDALAVCERLRLEFPEAPDWLERSAMVHAARGDTVSAIDFYRRTLAFTELPQQRDGFDQGIRDQYRHRIAELEAKLTTPLTTPT
jgi:hypothetical protein